MSLTHGVTSPSTFITLKTETINTIPRQWTRAEKRSEDRDTSAWRAAARLVFIGVYGDRLRLDRLGCYPHRCLLCRSGVGLVTIFVNLTGTALFAINSVFFSGFAPEPCSRVSSLIYFWEYGYFNNTLCYAYFERLQSWLSLCAFACNKYNETC